jgi:hypothetical protein
VTTPDAGSIDRIALVRPGSATHGIDFEQRLVELPFTSGAGSLEVTGPPGPTSAPPGHYMLFLVDGDGVPSVASWVHLT